MSIWPDPRLLDLLQIEHAIIQAPMAGSTTPALAAAVSNAGALGSLGCAMMDPAAVRDSVQEIRARTNRSFNINFFCHTPPRDDPARNAHASALFKPFYDALGIAHMPAVEASNFPFDQAMLDAMLALRPHVLSFHFGLPDAALLAPLKEAGIVLMSSATSAREARFLEASGVDAIIAQGFEAGGHRGHFESDFEASCVGSMALIPQIVDAVKVPVIAAGGIGDGRGIAAALMLGASGVQLGTAFLTTPEASVPGVHRDAILAADGSETRYTRVFSGRPARGIDNRIMRSLAPEQDALPDFPLLNTLTKPLRAPALERGDSGLISLWAGQALSLNRTLPAAELVEKLVEDTTQRLRGVRREP